MTARGSGDNDSTTGTDEGYVGETGSFGPDKIFFASLVKPINADPVDPAAFSKPLPTFRLGAGIANKDYLGLTYIENTFSLLNTLVHDVLGVQDVTAYSTTIKYHDYRLRRLFNGERGAGHEYDFESLIEGPKGVKTTLGAAYYRPGAAVQSFVRKNLLMLYSNVTISFN